MKSNQKICWQLAPMVATIALVLSCVSWTASARQIDQVQQNSVETSNLASAGEYPVAPLLSTLVNLDSFGSGSLSPSGYLNTKRARKMSAFVPMRGRRDPGLVSGSEQLPLFLANVGGDSDNEISVLRLVSAGQPNGFEGRWSAMAPRQFASQMAARHSGDQLDRGDEQVPAASGGYLGAPMMQAKLRRAFHPMRGKRLPGLGVDTPFDELQSDT